MKARYAYLLLVTASLLTAPLAAETYHLVVDAAQMNSLYTALGGSNWKNTTGWPVPEGEQATSPIPTANATYMTRVRTSGEDRVVEYYLKDFRLSGQGATGQIPSPIAFDSLRTFAVQSEEGITGPFPAITSPKIEEISFVRVNLTGAIPSYGGEHLESLTLNWTLATDSIPGIVGPNLRELTIRYNDQLNGKLGTVDAPNLETLYLQHSKLLTGKIYAFNFPKAKSIVIEDCPLLGGTITNLVLPELEKLEIRRTGIGGELPETDLPKLELLIIEESQITGDLPTLNAPVLVKVSLYNNNLNGRLHPQTLPALEWFSIQGNTMTGPIPALTLPACTYFLIDGNRFDGRIEQLDFPSMEVLSARECGLQGELPEEWSSTNLRELYLPGNMISGTLPNWTLAGLTGLDLTSNNLTGPIPPWSMPKLTAVQMSYNQLEGDVPQLDLPWLNTLYLESNAITGLPKLRDGCPDLYYLAVSNNKLTFGSIESNVDVPSFTYIPQDEIPLYWRETPDKKTVLYVEVDGTANKYDWYKVDDQGAAVKIATDTGDNLLVEDLGSTVYFCKVRSTKVSLVLTSSRVAVEGGPSKGVIVGGLEFVTESDDGWQKITGTNKIKTSGKVTINQFLVFEGAIEIDTVSVSLTVTGKFILENVPLPGGGQGTFTVCDAIEPYTLKILGTDGRITEFINAKLTALPMIAGVEVKLTEIKLLGGRNATGISINGKMKITGMKNGCYQDKPGDAEFEITDLAFKRDSGFSVGGMVIKNLGLSFFPKFCVKEIKAAYDNAKNKLSLGAKIDMPFVEVGGGVALIGYDVDSLHWRMDVKTKALPIGTTNFGMSGLFGKIWDIKTTPLKIELGGIFKTLIPDAFAKFDVSGTYEAPSTLGLKVDGGVVPSLSDAERYQVKFNGSAAYDFALSILKLDGGVKVGTNDGEKYFVDGQGKLNLYAETRKMTGRLEGSILIEPFGAESLESYPYDWLMRKHKWPWKFSAKANFVRARWKLLFGVAHLGETLGDLKFVFDFSKKWDDPDFLYWDRTEAAQPLLGGVPGVATDRTAIIPLDVSRMVVRIVGEGSIPATTLTDPSGTTHTPGEVGAGITYDEDVENDKVFWTVVDPVAGSWMVSAPSVLERDRIKIYVHQRFDGIDFTLTQQERSVTIDWQPSGSSGDSVSFFVTGTQTSADGIHLGTTSLLAGSLELNLSENLPVCSFLVEAQGVQGFDAFVDTLGTTVEIENERVLAPSNMRAMYFTGQERVNITWTPAPSSDTNVTSYVVHVKRSDGAEELLGSAFRWVGWVTLPYLRQEGDRILVRGVDETGLTGCPSEIMEVTTDLQDLADEDITDIVAIPHPVKNEAVIAFNNTGYGAVTISIFDVQGRQVINAPLGALDVGVQRHTVRMGGLPTGLYIVLVQTSDGILRTPVVVAR